HLFTRMPISLNGFLFQVEAYLSWPPQTRLIVPPVGQVRAATHRSPVAFDITLWEVDLDAVRRLLLSQNIQEIWEGWSLPSFPGVPSSPDNLDDALAAAVRHAAQWLLMRAGALGFAGGALGSLLTAGFLPARRWLLGGFLGLALSVSLVVPAYLTYDTQAFSRPRITGIMEA